MKTVRLGIVGIGSMGRHHARMVLRGLVPGCELAAIADIDPAKLHGFETVPRFPSLETMLDSGLVEAVLIATPHYSHTTLGIAALEAGLHLLVEKPISVHKRDGERLVAAHRNEGKVFSAMFNQRTDPAYQKVRSMVHGGELGTISRVQWTITNWFRSQAYYDSGGWRATWAGEGGGVLLNQCVHNIDLYQWIFGLPRTIRALCRIGRYHHIEVEDEVTAIFEHEAGFSTVFVTSTGEAPGINRLEIVGDRGRLTLENDRLVFLHNEIETSRYSRETQEGYIQPPCNAVEFPLEGRGEQHLGILKNFTNAILADEPLLAPAAEGLASLEMINGMLLSSFENRVVELPIDALAYETLLQKLIAASTFQKTTRDYAGGVANYLVKNHL